MKSWGFPGIIPGKLLSCKGKTMTIGTAQKRILILAAILVPAICYAVFCVTGNMYTYTDNVTVAVVTSGMYGDNNFCQYLHPFFCLIIKWMNPLLPTADMFTMLIHVALIFGAGLLSYIAFNSVLQKPFRQWDLEDYILCALLALAIVYATLGMNLFGVNYTVQTAAIILSGVLVMFYGRNRKNGGFWVVLGTVLICFGYLIRLEAALIFVPFIALEVMAGFLRAEDKKEHLKKDLKTIFPCILILLLILASKFIFNAIEPYASDARYNKHRTTIEDYWMDGYDRYDPSLEGIDQSTYSVARDWILVDTDRLNADTLEQIAISGTKSAYPKTLKGLRLTIKAMYRRITHEDLHLLIMTVLAIILTLWNVIRVRSLWLKLESIFAFGGGFIILFYFTFMGRAPMRVWQCVLLAALAVLILVMVKDAEDTEKAVKEGKGKISIINTVFQLFLCVVLYFGVGQVMAVSSFHPFQTPLTAKIGADDSGYEETFDGDTLYIWPSWYNAVPDYFAKQNKLPTKRVIEHNIAIGDWTYEQQYFIDFLERIDARNPAVALLERPNTYLVDGQTKELLWYMREHYGEEIELQQVSKIEGRKVFKLICGGDADDIYKGELDERPDKTDDGE